MIQNILLYSIIHAFSTGGAIVIDGTDLTDGTWRLSDGRPMFQNWRSGEPNNDNEHCVMMFADGTQNDITCTASMYFICERQLNLQFVFQQILNLENRVKDETVHFVQARHNAVEVCNLQNSKDKHVVQR